MVFGVGIPRGVPLVDAVPERHLLLIVRRPPRLRVGKIGAAVREIVSTDGHVQNEMELPIGILQEIMAYSICQNCSRGE